MGCTQAVTGADAAVNECHLLLSPSAASTSGPYFCCYFCCYILVQVTTCLDKTLEIIDCPQKSTSCSDVSIPTGVPSDEASYYTEYGYYLDEDVASN